MVANGYPANCQAPASLVVPALALVAPGAKSVAAEA